ncbi:cytidine deaminase [Dietzia sp. SYD-A1]|uniref:cytidine deaminase n=1 Tax=Dietzia sp. SYD-A1 TaxID=2780141 RepID=UPI001891D7BF
MSFEETAAQGNEADTGLREAATAAARNAYRPYSGLGVGAAALASGPGRDGRRIVTGCNVENASYGLTLCAECSLVSDLHRTGGGRLLEIVVVTAGGDPLAPCGRCRQLLHEHGGPELVVHTSRGRIRLADLLPDAFGPEDLT